jgi:hypothetical protein
MTDTDRLNYILGKASDDFRFDIQNILGDYDGDDDEQYLASARLAIDEAIEREDVTR